MATRFTYLAVITFAVPAAADPPRTDLHGDPLSDRVLARFGTLRFRIGNPMALALSPDGKVLAADTGTDLTFWDVDTGRPVRRVQGHEFGRPCASRRTAGSWPTCPSPTSA